MTVPSLTSVPRGTRVRLTIVVPNRPQGDGFEWVADQTMTADQAREQISRILVARFLNEFLPADD